MKSKKILILLLLLFNFIIFPNISRAQNIEDTFKIYSEAVLLMDSRTGIILYEKNSKQIMFPASTTKILTAILAIENCNLEETLTVTQTAISNVPNGYSTCNLQVGEEISVDSLLNAFLVHSANDAGYVLAEHISGSISTFSDLMNKKAKEIGCENSHFTNPSGIHNDNHFSTAYDLCLIANYCMKNPSFRKYVSKESCIIPPTNKSGARQYYNTNELLNPNSKYYIGSCIGIKTGYTSQAQNCLISCFRENNLEFIAVVLGGNYTENNENTRFVDSRSLYEYGFSNYSLKTLANKGDIITSIVVENGSKETKDLNLFLENDVIAFSKNSDTNPEYKIELKEDISAPISENSCLGTITYSVNGVNYTQNLLASHNVEKKWSIFLILGQYDTLFLIFLFLFILTIILSIITIIYVIVKHIKKKSKNYDII